MKFVTMVNIDRFQEQIEHYSSILTIGSCFADNIGSYFSRYKFNSIINPFGVLYNTASINNNIKLVVEKKKFSLSDLIINQDEYHSFFHHSDFSSHDSEKVIGRINSTSEMLNAFIQKVDWVIISLGTSFIYRHKKTDTIVSNCHKIPQKEFDKEFLSVEANFENISSVIKQIRSQKADAKFLITVSPIRHWKDGAHNNQLSKASLHLAINEVCKSTQNVFYFPSYEIQIDELRDYRFYEKDMIHPSNEAVEYIWEKFSSVCLSTKCINLINEIEKVVQASKHRIRSPQSQKTKEFAASNISKIKNLVEQNPYLNFEEELKQFYSYLDN